MANRTINYIRVSTVRQGRSGLGIEAQRHALLQFAQAEGLEVLGEFVEVETGKWADALDRRPERPLQPPRGTDATRLSPS